VAEKNPEGVQMCPDALLLFEDIWYGELSGAIEAFVTPNLTCMARRSSVKTGLKGPSR
jgi:hypothetical protein